MTTPWKYKATIVWGLAVAVVTVVLLGFFLKKDRIIRPAIHAESNGALSISQFEAKIIPVDDGGGSGKPASKTIQWRCKITNLQPKDARYALRIRLKDKDDFYLGELSYDSETKHGDIKANGTQDVFQNDQFPEKAFYSIATIEAEWAVFPTRAQEAEEAAKIQRKRNEEWLQMYKIESEAREAAEALQKQAAEKEEADRIRWARNKKMIDAIASESWLANWRKLATGMHQIQVEELLGKPQTASAYQWTYAQVYDLSLGSYVIPQVYFNIGGRVDGWEGPKM